MKMTLGKTAGDIFAECKAGFRLTELKSGAALVMRNFAAFENCAPGDMVFVSDTKKIKDTLARRPAGLVLSAADAAKIEITDSMAIFVSEHVGVSYALMRQKYNDRDYTESGFARIHPTAVIHESVSIPEDIIVGPFAVIERGVKLGARVVVQAHVLIEFEAEIGDGTIIQKGSIIGFQCQLGENCLVLPNSCVGSEGFGYSQDEDFNHHRIPQTGNVVLGDKVTVGALNTIDRGTYGSTIFHNGVICDNICHTAHNCEIGENSILLTGWKMAGSSKTGKRVVASGDTMVKDHVTICDDAVFVHRAGVITDITEKGMYAQSPSQPFREYLKNWNAYKNLSEMAKELKDLRKQVAELTASNSTPSVVKDIFNN